MSNGEIDLTTWAQDLDNAMAEGRTVVVATCHDGEPDLAFKGSVLVWDKKHLAFWERGAGEILAGLRSNRRVAFLYHAPRERRQPPLRLYGAATLIEEGELRDRIWDRVIPAEQARDPERKGAAVLVRIDRVRQGGNVFQDDPASATT